MGVSLRTYQINEAEDKKYVLGMVTGISATIALKQSSPFYFQPEILFIQKRYQYVQSIPVFPFQAPLSATINYVEFPLLAKAILDKQKLQYYLVAGPSIGVGLQGHYSTYYNNDSLTALNRAGKIKFREKPDRYTGADAYYYRKGYNKIDFGLQIGTGISFVIGKRMLIADIRYGLGLNHLIKHHTFYIPYSDPNLGEIEIGLGRQADMKSRTFVASIGYMIPFKKIP